MIGYRDDMTSKNGVRNDDDPAQRELNMTSC